MFSFCCFRHSLTVIISMISSKVIFCKMSRLRGNKYSKWIPCIKWTAVLRSDSGFRPLDPRNTSRMQIWQSGRTSYPNSHLHPIVGWKLRSEFANHLQEGKYISPTACSENGKSHLWQWEPLLPTAFSSAEAFESSHCLLNSLDSRSQAELSNSGIWQTWTASQWFSQDGDARLSKTRPTSICHSI